MTNVHALPNKADPKIVEAFEKLLARAKSGEIVGFNVVCELTEHRIHTHSNVRDNFMLLAYLSRQLYLANDVLSSGPDLE